MIKESDGKLGVRELTSIVLVMILLKSTDTTPTLLFEEAQNAAWITPIISISFMFIPLYMTISLLKLYKDKNLIDVVYHLTGKYIGFLIGMIYFALLFISLIVNSRSYVDIMNTLFFPRTPVFILQAIIILVACSIAKRGYENLGRTAWMFVPALQIVAIGFIFFTKKDMNTNFIFPLAGNGVVNTIGAGITRSTYLGDIFYLAMLYRYSRNHRDFVKATAIGLGISIVEIMVLMFIYISVFDYPSIVFLNYPFQELTRIANLGKYFKNTEAFYFGFWVISALLRFSAYLYFTTAAFAQTIKVKEFEPLIIPVAALVPVIGIIPENFVENILTYRSILVDYGWIFFFTTPVALYFIARVRGDYRK